MINKDEGSITVFDEDNNSTKVHFIFDFEVPEFNKRYLVYTLNANSQTEGVDILISEIDFNTYEIKSIPEKDLTTVIECYNNIVNMMTNEA